MGMSVQYVKLFLGVEYYIRCFVIHSRTPAITRQYLNSLYHLLHLSALLCEQNKTDTNKKKKCRELYNKTNLSITPLLVITLPAIFTCSVRF